MSELKRHMGLFQLTMYGTGLILGAGIYVLIGEAAGFAGDSVWIDTVDGQIVNLGAEYFVKLDNDKNVSGFGLVNDGSSSEFKILADKFTIVDPNAPTNATATPFTVSGGVTYMQNVVVGNTVIANDAITTDKINVGNLSSISANLGTVTAGTMKTANSGYRVEVSDAGDFPIWYGTGSKTAANGLFYVKKDGQVYINAVINAQAGSNITVFDVSLTFNSSVYGSSSNAVVVRSAAADVVTTFSGGSGSYSYAWSKLADLGGPAISANSVTVLRPRFSATLGNGVEAQSQWRLTVTDTSNGAISREDVIIGLVNIGPIGGGS